MDIEPCIALNEDPHINRAAHDCARRVRHYPGALVLVLCSVPVQPKEW